jgi:arsenate reductase
MIKIGICMKLLFICVGNTCRSQMAEAIARHIGHNAVSAGTNPGIEIAPNSIIVLSELDIIIKGQYPKSIDSINLIGFDKIISMGCGVECPKIRIDEDWNLVDPFGKDINFYRKTRDKISNYLSGLE